MVGCKMTERTRGPVSHWIPISTIYLSYIKLWPNMPRGLDADVTDIVGYYTVQNRTPYNNLTNQSF